jgi:hypothetical protein
MKNKEFLLYVHSLARWMITWNRDCHVTPPPNKKKKKFLGRSRFSKKQFQNACSDSNHFSRTQKKVHLKSSIALSSTMSLIHLSSDYSYKVDHCLESIYTGGQVLLSKDEQFLLTTANDNVHLMDLRNGQKVTSFPSVLLSSKSLMV